jgi:hypothetical protein
MVVPTLAPDEQPVLTYGPPDPTRLTVAVLDEHGEKVRFVLEAEAIHQLAKLLRQIERQCPGAINGH